MKNSKIKGNVFNDDGLVVENGIGEYSDENGNGVSSQEKFGNLTNSSENENDKFLSELYCEMHGNGYPAGGNGAGALPEDINIIGENMISFLGLSGDGVMPQEEIEAYNKT